MIFLMCLILVTPALWIQTILHELGHFLFGCLYGLDFMALSIYSRIIIKKNGKILVKRWPTKIGTGYCSMSPGEKEGKKISLIMYIMGGMIANLVVSVVLFILSYWINNDLLCGFIRTISIVGIYLVILNAFPLDVLGNDGSKILNLAKNSNLYKYIFVNGLITQKLADSVRLKDMPQEWFNVPDGDVLQCSQGASFAYQCIMRKLDELDISGTQDLLQEVLRHDISSYMFGNLRLEQLYCELVDKNRSVVIDHIISPAQAEGLIKHHRNLKTMRVLYTYILMYRKDVTWATGLRLQFESLAKRWPYEGEALTELSLVEYAWDVFVEKNHWEEKQDIDDEDRKNTGVIKS